MTVYGVANVGFSSTNGSATAMTGGADGADSRIGFTGTEDLGGGLKAGFTLEAGLNATNGAFTDANPFQRQSFVNLSSASLGEVRFGRQYTLGFNSTIASMPSTYTDAGLAVGLGFAGMGSRNSDQIQYRSPSFGGFAVHGSTQLAGDTTVGTVAAQNSEVRLAYTNGPLALNGTYAASKAVAGGATVNPYGLNATYDFGSFKIYGGYINTDRTGNMTTVTGVTAQTTTGKGYVVKGYLPLGSNNLFIGYANNTTQDTSAYELGNY